MSVASLWEGSGPEQGSRCTGPEASVLCLRTRGRRRKGVDETDEGKSLGDRSLGEGNSLRGWKRTVG